MGRNGTRGWNRWWWDVTVWGTILVTVLVHAVLHEWTQEHTLAAALIGAWVAFALFHIRRARTRNDHDDAGMAFHGTATRQQRQHLLGRVLALIVLAVMVVLILGTGNLMAPTTALGVWAAFELIQRRDRADPLERHPPDPSLHHSTRRN